MASGSKELAAGVVCRGEIAEWVKKIVGGVWSVGGCGLSGRKRRVGQENWRRRLVCRDKFVAWVKRPVGGVWSVGVKTASGSRGLSAGVVWRGKFVAWVKGTVARVWSVGAKMLRGSKGLSLECGLSGRKRRVNQRNHTYRMPETLQIATQIKIAKTLKT